MMSVILILYKINVERNRIKATSQAVLNRWSAGLVFIKQATTDNSALS